MSSAVEKKESCVTAVFYHSNNEDFVAQFGGAMADAMSSDDESRSVKVAAMSNCDEIGRMELIEATLEDDDTSDSEKLEEIDRILALSSEKLSARLEARSVGDF
jgi:hypothetical protein